VTDSADDVGILLVVGTINADIEVRTSEPPRLGSTHLGFSLLRASGGKGANVAVLAARQGVRARLFGCVGDDDLAAQALAGPREAGVDLSAVRVVRGPTGFATILVAPDGNKIIVMAPGANDSFGEPDSVAVAMALRRLAMRAALVADLEVAPEAVPAVLRAARAAGVPTVLDPAPPSRLDPDALLLVDHVTPNAAETTELTGIDVRSTADAARAATRLRDLGAGAAYVRTSDGCCVVASAGGVKTVRPPAEVRVVDTTGAGDAFTGALAVAVLRGLPPAEAAMVGVAAASCAVGGYGSQASYPTAAQLDAMTRRVRDAQAVWSVGAG
jgi:ribokinase